MLDFLKKIFTYKKKELEVKLRPTSECTHGGVAEIEVEYWSDETISYEVSMKHSNFADGTQLEFVSGTRTIATVTTSNGYVKHSEYKIAPGQFPDIKIGDEAQVRVNEEVLYKGNFRRD